MIACCQPRKAAGSKPSLARMVSTRTCPFTACRAFYQVLMPPFPSAVSTTHVESFRFFEGGQRRRHRPGVDQAGRVSGSGGKPSGRYGMLWYARLCSTAIVAPLTINLGCPAHACMSACATFAQDVYCTFSCLAPFLNGVLVLGLDYGTFAIFAVPLI